MSALTTIAQAINAEHSAAHAQAHAALESARKCGELLLQAKAELVHGQWLPWVAANLTFGTRQAQKYIRLAESWDRLPNANSDAHLLTSIDVALQAVSAPLPSLLGSLQEFGPGWAYHVEELGLSPRRGVFMRPADDEIILVEPSEHDGWFYVFKLRRACEHVEHFQRPLNLAGVAVALDVLGVKPDDCCAGYRCTVNERWFWQTFGFGKKRTDAVSCANLREMGLML